MLGYLAMTMVVYQTDYEALRAIGYCAILTISCIFFPVIIFQVNQGLGNGYARIVNHHGNRAEGFLCCIKGTGNTGGSGNGS